MYQESLFSNQISPINLSVIANSIIVNHQLTKIKLDLSNNDKFIGELDNLFRYLKLGTASIFYNFLKKESNLSAEKLERIEAILFSRSLTESTQGSNTSQTESTNKNVIEFMAESKLTGRFTLYDSLSPQISATDVVDHLKELYDNISSFNNHYTTICTFTNGNKQDLRLFTTNRGYLCYKEKVNKGVVLSYMIYSIK